MMKHFTTLLMASAISLCSISYAQNTFPSNGNVGVGTVTPKAILHVKDTEDEARIIVQANTNSGYKNFSELMLSTEMNAANSADGSEDAGRKAIIRALAQSDSGQWVRLGFFTSAYKTTYPKERLSIAPNGKVGIGIIKPLHKLHVIGNSNTEGNAYVSGKIGVGTTSPSHKLHVLGHANIDGNTLVSGKLGIGTTSPSFKLHVIGHTNTEGNALVSGKVGIGITEWNEIPNEASLAVNGGIIATRIRCASFGSDDWVSWADYVFDEEYKLMPLNEVEQFVSENKHLPEIPSAKEVANHGVDLIEMNVLLLKKVEELTLHTITQEKRIHSLEQQLK